MTDRTAYVRHMFGGRRAALATKHGKERVIAPLFKRELGIDVLVPERFDSDRFGTFTGEVTRMGSQLEAARAKAHAALDATGLDLAIASEGGFDADADVPFVQSNLELVILIDKKHDLEIRGHYRSTKTNAHGAYVRSVAEAYKLAQKWGFPDHGVIVRKSEKSEAPIYKDLTDIEEFLVVVEDLLSRRIMRKIYIETDMRAFRNPTRMKNIDKATRDLIENVQSVCDACFMPGFVITDVVKGLPCRGCGRPTTVPQAAIRTCEKCGHVRENALGHGKAADPSLCGFCNP